MFALLTLLLSNGLDDSDLPEIKKNFGEVRELNLGSQIKR